MGPVLALSADARTTAGVLLLTVVAIAAGGVFVSRLTRGLEPATDFQLAFSRAGHGHAGVLVSLALITQVLADATELIGVVAWVARYGVAWSAVLIPAGFFFSAVGPGRTSPNRFILLLYAGAAALVAGVVTLGVGLLVQ